MKTKLVAWKDIKVGQWYYNRHKYNATLPELPRLKTGEYSRSIQGVDDTLAKSSIWFNKDIICYEITGPESPGKQARWQRLIRKAIRVLQPKDGSIGESGTVKLQECINLMKEIIAKG